jgi:hypothetical protein
MGPTMLANVGLEGVLRAAFSGAIFGAAIGIVLALVLVLVRRLFRKPPGDDAQENQSG